MANGIRIGNPRGFIKGRSSKFRLGARVRQTPEEGPRTYRPKRSGNNNKDEDNSQKTLNDKKIEIIWTRIDQVFRLRNHILLSKTPCISQMIFFLKYSICLSNKDEDNSPKTLYDKKIEIIWTRIDQVIRLRNYIVLSKTSCISQMIFFLKYSICLGNILSIQNM